MFTTDRTGVGAGVRPPFQLTSQVISSSPAVDAVAPIHCLVQLCQHGLDLCGLGLWLEHGAPNVPELLEGALVGLHHGPGNVHRIM